LFFQTGITFLSPFTIISPIFGEQVANYDDIPSTGGIMKVGCFVCIYYFIFSTFAKYSLHSQVKALFDFYAEMDDELSLRCGEILTVENEV
jgi:hypothetical protein